jgi:hypothetical protein
MKYLRRLKNILSKKANLFAFLLIGIILFLFFQSLPHLVIL